MLQPRLSDYFAAISAKPILPLYQNVTKPLLSAAFAPRALGDLPSAMASDCNASIRLSRPMDC